MPASLRWLDPPPEAPLAQARELLHGLEAIDAAGRATPLGRRMAALGLHPRLAHMVVRAGPLGQTRLAVELAALLSERDPLRAAPGARDPDIRLRIDVLHGAPPPAGMEVDRGAVQRIRQSVERLERQLARPGDAIRRDAVRRVRAGARCAGRRRAAARLRLSRPDRARPRRRRWTISALRAVAALRSPGPTALARSEYIVVAALDLGEREARIELAAPLDLRLLDAHFAAAIEERDIVAWDARAEAVLARRQTRLGALLLRDDPLPVRIRARSRAALLEGIRALGLAAPALAAGARAMAGARRLRACAGTRRRVARRVGRRR